MEPAAKKARVQEDAPVVVCFGDSNTYGNESCSACVSDGVVWRGVCGRVACVGSVEIAHCMVGKRGALVQPVSTRS